MALRKPLGLGQPQGDSAICSSRTTLGQLMKMIGRRGAPVRARCGAEPVATTKG